MLGAVEHSIFHPEVTSFPCVFDGLLVHLSFVTVASVASSESRYSSSSIPRFSGVPYPPSPSASARSVTPLYVCHSHLCQQRNRGYFGREHTPRYLPLFPVRWVRLWSWFQIWTSSQDRVCPQVGCITNGRDGPRARRRCARVQTPQTRTHYVRTRG